MSAEVADARRTQSDMLAGLRHDLRTPLTVIGGFAEALLDGTAQGPDATRAASAIAEETARLERMIDELGDLADLESGGRPLAPRTARRDERLCRRHRAFRWPGRRRMARPSTRSRSPDSLPFAADRGAVDRILANLIANGLAHAPRPGGHVSVEAAGLPDGELLLAVRDDGPGIPPAALVHVFERFYRADPSRSGPGSGLGLAIVEQLAEAHGGRAFADNLAGGGARVGVVLPVSPPPARGVARCPSPCPHEPQPRDHEDADVLVPHRPRLGRSRRRRQPARPGQRGRARRPARRRQRGRRGHRHQRRPGRRRGARVWPGWRRVLADLGRRELQGLNGSGRSGVAATLEAARAANGDRLPVRGPVDGDRARRHPLVGRRARALRAAPVARPAGAGHRAGRGLPGVAGAGGPPWSARRRSSGPTPTGRAPSGPHGRPWRVGEIVVVPGLATTLAPDRRRGARPVYDGSARGAGGRVSRLARRAASTLDDLADHASDLDDARSERRTAASRRPAIRPTAAARSRSSCSTC